MLAHAAIGVEKAFLGLQEHLRLPQRGHIQVGQHIAQMLLRQRRTDGADRHADHRRRLAVPDAVPVGARTLVQRILEHAGHGAVVLRRHEQHRIGAADGIAELLDHGHLVAVGVLVVQGQLPDRHLLELHLRRGQLDQGMRQLAVERCLAQTAHDHRNLVLAHHKTPGLGMPTIMGSHPRPARGHRPTWPPGPGPSGTMRPALPFAPSA